MLTGGASSIYGSDAVAGVVNFIMNDHFEGIQFDWNGSGYNHQQNSFVGDIVAREASDEPRRNSRSRATSASTARRRTSRMTMGGNFANGKGNATVFFEYRQQQDPVLQNSRDFSECSLVGGNDGLHLRRLQHELPGAVRRLHQLHLRPHDRQCRRWRAGRTSARQDQFNFAPYNYFQRPDTRYLANFFAHYDALPEVRVYTEFDFMNDHTLAQIAPSGAFLQPFTLNINNPLLSQSFKDAVGLSAANPIPDPLHRPPQRRGRRAGSTTSPTSNYRIVLGAKGSVWDDKWNYDAWWQSGQNIDEPDLPQRLFGPAPAERVRRRRRIPRPACRRARR